MAPERHSVLRRSAFWLAMAAAAAPLVSITVSHILLAASVVALLIVREKPQFPPLKLPLALFIAGTLLAVLLSDDPAAGWPQVRKFYVFLLVLFSVATALRSAAVGLTLIRLWAAVGAVSAGWGLIQFGQRYLAAEGGPGRYNALVGQRITGFMSLWQTFAGQMMIVLLMVGALLLFSAEGRRSWKPLGAAAMLVAAALVLALTRGPWVGAAAGTVYLMWHWNRKSLLALPVVAVAAFFIAPSTLQDRVTSISQANTYQDSNQHRVVLWRSGLEMIKAHPWFGLGPERVAPQLELYVPADIPRPLPWGWRGHLHNVYLQYAAERGIPVLMVFLWMIGKALWDFWRAARSHAEALGIEKAILHGSVAAIVAVLVAGLFEHNLGDSEMLQMFLSVVALGYAALRLPDQPLPAPQDGELKLTAAR